MTAFVNRVGGMIWGLVTFICCCEYFLQHNLNMAFLSENVMQILSTSKYSSRVFEIELTEGADWMIPMKSKQVLSELKKDECQYWDWWF